MTKSENRSEYSIASGVEWVNGKRLKGEKTISLTDEQAAYDLALGRISDASPNRSSTPKKSPSAKPVEVTEPFEEKVKED